MNSLYQKNESFFRCKRISNRFKQGISCFLYTARILSLADHPKFTLYTSPVCLAIAYYFAEKKTSAKVAKSKISSLLEHIQVADNGRLGVLKTLENKKILDFEDGL
jgi:hypothetical protein